MANIILNNELTIAEKMNIMHDDARFEVASDDGCHEALDMTGAVSAADVVRAKSPPPKAPKIFLSNDCSFNCAYCGCRSSHDKQRYCYDPKELARMAVIKAKQERQGIFITSAIYKNADYTEELIIEAIKAMRKDFNQHCQEDPHL